MSYQNSNKYVYHNNERYIAEKNSDNFSPFPEAIDNKRPMQIVNPLYEQYIIKPPNANVTHGSIPDIEVICSEDRNFTLYPDPNNYIIPLKNTYKNITSITLFSAGIPNSSYVIDNRNNLIYFRESFCKLLIAEVKNGDYVESDDLIMELENALNNAGGESTYTVTFDSVTNKLTFISDLSGGDHIFSLEFNNGTEKHDYTTRNTYIIITKIIY